MSRGFQGLLASKWTQVHLVEPAGVSPVFRNNVIRIHDILEGLAHLRRYPLNRLTGRLLDPLFLADLFDLVNGNKGRIGTLVSE